MSVLYYISLVAVFFILRLWPIWPSRFQGCDAYYFLLCSSELRRNRHLPIVLPEYFLLEPREQSYPPGFSIFLSLFPPDWMLHRYWLVNHLLDFLVALVIFIFLAMSHGLFAASIGTFAYGAQGAVMNEYRSMTSRPLAVVFFVAFLFCSELWVQGSWPALPAAVVAGTLLLFTHKLSVQLSVFLVFFMSLVGLEEMWLISLIGSYALALVLGRRLFLDILKAHFDIVTFWGRNWPWLGAHQVRQSPIYGDGRTQMQYYRKKGLLGILELLRILFHINYWILFLPFIIYTYTELGLYQRFLALWLLGTYAWSFLTIMVPWLRAFGLGQQYIKYAYIPSFLLAFDMVEIYGNWLWVLVAVCTLLTLRYYMATAQNMRVQEINQIGCESDDLEAVIREIQRIPDARLMCFPVYLNDLIAYRTKRPVLWGTHGYGFMEVEPFFPVLREPLEYFVARYKVSYLLLDQRFVTSKELFRKETDKVFEHGRYTLYAFGDA